MFITNAYFKIHGKFIMPFQTCFGRKKSKYFIKPAPPVRGKWLLQKTKEKHPYRAILKKKD